LMDYAKGELGEKGADVVVPNCVWKTYNEMGYDSQSLFFSICTELTQPMNIDRAYDRNNWIETPESLEMQKTLSSSSVLLEGEHFSELQ